VRTRQRRGIMRARHLERDDFSSNRHPALSFCLSMTSAQTLRVCREGKPVPTPHQVRGRLFPDHGLIQRRPGAHDRPPHWDLPDRPGGPTQCCAARRSHPGGRNSSARSHSVMVARKNCKIFQNSRQKCLNRFGDSWLIPYAVMALARRDRTGRSPTQGEWFAAKRRVVGTECRGAVSWLRS